MDRLIANQEKTRGMSLAHLPKRVGRSKRTSETIVFSLSGRVDAGLD